MDPNKLNLLMPPPLEMSLAAPLPRPSGVLYAPPNKDATAKACDNCFMYVPSVEKCEIHERRLRVLPTAVCGYHVEGTPHDAWEEHGISPVDPKLSGLINTGQGTSCDTCRYYRPRGPGSMDGLCMAVVGDAGEPVIVEALACCARFELSVDSRGKTR